MCKQAQLYSFPLLSPGRRKRKKERNENERTTTTTHTKEWKIKGGGRKTRVRRIRTSRAAAIAPFPSFLPFQGGYFLSAGCPLPALCTQRLMWHEEKKWRSPVAPRDFLPASAAKLSLSQDSSRKGLQTIIDVRSTFGARCCQAQLHGRGRAVKEGRLERLASSPSSLFLREKSI